MIRNQTQDNNSNHRNSTFHQDSPSLAITSSFIKQQITKIIKEELKNFGNRNKLQAELETYQKKMLNQQLHKTLCADRIKAFREKQQSFRRKQYDEFLQKQKTREVKLNRFKENKQNCHQSKFAEISSFLSQVKEKHKHIINEDTNFRLNKLSQFTSSKSRMDVVSRHSSTRVLSTSQSQEPREMQQKTQARETYLVTSYLKKIERCESRVLSRDLQNQKRSKTSKSNRVKCLVEQRNKGEVDKMDRVQNEYNTRMNRFAASRNKVFHMRESVQKNRSMLNLKKFQMAEKKRYEQTHQEALENQNDFQHGKESFFKEYKSMLDHQNSVRNMKLNLKKMKDEENSLNLEKMMKLLTEKLQKTRNVKYGEKLDSFSVNQILSMLDKKDPDYNAIFEFLQSERRLYLQNVIKKEEERKKFDKSKKGNKMSHKKGLL